jgi:hypothetical protein
MGTMVRAGDVKAIAGVNQGTPTVMQETERGIEDGKSFTWKGDWFVEQGSRNEIGSGLD